MIAFTPVISNKLCQPLEFQTQILPVYRPSSFPQQSESISMDAFRSNLYRSMDFVRSDPIFPRLFNIAVNPFLCALSANTAIQDHQFSSRGLSSASTRDTFKPIKVLAYADDTLVLLNSTSDMSALLQTITLYERSFNAKLNHSKTQAFSLSGTLSTTWTNFLQQLPTLITSWHNL